MQAPIGSTSFNRQYYIQEAYRSNMTDRILGTVNPLLGDLNEGRTRGKFWFPDYYYWFMIPLLFAFLIVEAILLGLYFGPKDLEVCQTRYDECRTAQTKDFCQAIYDECYKSKEWPHAMYIALIVVGSVGAFYLLIMLILLFVVAKIEIRESARVEEIYRRHLPLFEQTQINPKYSMTLRQQRSCCWCGSSTAPTVVIQPRGVQTYNTDAGNMYDDIEFAGHNQNYQHARFDPKVDHDNTIGFGRVSDKYLTNEKIGKNEHQFL